MSSQNQDLPEKLHVTEAKATDPVSKIKSLEAVCIHDHTLGFVAQDDETTAYFKPVENSNAWVSANELSEIGCGEDEQDHLIVGYHSAELSRQFSHFNDIVIAPVKFMPFWGENELHSVDFVELTNDTAFITPKDQSVVSKQRQ